MYLWLVCASTHGPFSIIADPYAVAGLLELEILKELDYSAQLANFDRKWCMFSGSCTSIGKILVLLQTAFSFSD